jgi:hypothetical protein
VSRALGERMSEWKSHIPDESNRMTRYKCGLVAGPRVRLKKDITAPPDREHSTTEHV